MRVRIGENQNAQALSDLLLQIGDGTYPKEDELIRLRDDLCEIRTSLEQLIASVYSNLANMLLRKSLEFENVQFYRLETKKS